MQRCNVSAEPLYGDDVYPWPYLPEESRGIDPPRLDAFRAYKLYRPEDLPGVNAAYIRVRLRKQDGGYNFILGNMHYPNKHITRDIKLVL